MTMVGRYTLNEVTLQVGNSNTSGWYFSIGKIYTHEIITLPVGNTIDRTNIIHVVFRGKQDQCKVR